MGFINVSVFHNEYPSSLYLEKVNTDKKSIIHWDSPSQDGIELHDLEDPLFPRTQQFKFKHMYVFKRPIENKLLASENNSN